MLRVVTSANSEIFRHLGARALQSIGVEHTVAQNYKSALELIRTKHPHVAIFDAERPRSNGYELCKEVKSDPALADVRFILVINAVVSRDQLERLDACGCDDVLALPVRAEDFFHHVVQVAGLPYRQFTRIDVSFDCQVEARGVTLPAMVDNISLGGIGIRLEGDLPDGQLVTLRLEYKGQSFPPTRATVAWTRHIGKDKGNVIAGLSFAEMPVKTRLFVEELCLFDIRESDDGERVCVNLHGDFVETTDFSRLAAQLEDADTIEFNLREIHRMSSIGVQLWCQFLELLAGKTYYYRHASTVFTSQVAMIPTAAGDGEFLSFEAPYHCETCDEDDVRLLEAKSVLREGEEVVPPALHCSVCGGELTFDDLPWRYFAFIVRQRNW